MFDNNINPKRMTNLTWSESNNIELKKLEDLIGNIREKYLSMEADKLKKSYTAACKPVDMIDPGIIENALFNSKIEAINQKPKHTHGDEDQKIDFDAYE